MKKYLKLTSNEAIRHFVLRDKTLAPEAAHEIDHKLKDLDKLKSEISISLVLPTHRTHPDSDKDVITLKNLVTEAENAVHSMLNKRAAAVVVENMKEAQAAVDHSLNLDSMVLYANEYFASVVKLPIELEESIMIGKNFDLRPLYKTLQQNRRYYILTVSRGVIRLIEAFNDKAEQEIKNNDFPFVNRDYHVVDETKLMQDSFVDNQIKEYFNDADKSFQQHYNENPLPLILAGDVKSVSYYKEEMDNTDMIIGEVEGNFDNATLHEIMKVVFPEVEKYREKKQQEYMSQIDNAISAYVLSTDLNEIYRAAVEGAADTLYVGDNFALSGSIDEDNFEIEEEPSKEVNTNDILSELIKIVQDNGGNVIFVEDEKLKKYNGIVLARRF